MDTPRKTFILNFPFTTSEGILLEKISVRRATVGDLKAAAAQQGENPEEKSLFVASRQSGLLPADMEKMDLDDFSRIFQGDDLFFADGPPDGEKS